MKLKLTIETIGANGVRDLSAKEFDKRQIIIGRGVDADLRLEGQFVSLSHAVLFQQGDAFVIEDKGSLGGTLVNGIPTKRIRLNPNDLITIGDFKISVSGTGGHLDARLTIDRSQIVDLKGQIQADLKMVDSSSQLRWMRPISYLVVILSVLTFALWPSLDKSKVIWNPGELSISHRMLENSCESCHEANFKSISDQQCLHCHQLTAHSLKKEKYSEPTCVACHFEHRGAFGLLLKPSSECAECHDVENFEAHPEFEIRESISNLKFSHKEHLAMALPTRDGKFRLDCIDCHESADDREKMKAYSFEENCQNCHALTFDEGFSKLEVPHGDSQVVFEYLLKTYREKGIPQRAEINTLGIPGRSSKSSARPGSALQAARLAESYLFEEGPCFQCHEVKRNQSTSDSKANYEVLVNESPERWLRNSYALHSTHEAFSCGRCHSNAATSEVSQDNLIARVSDCQTCHSSKKTAEFIPSDCGLCHSYHRSIKLNPEKQRHRKEDE